MITYPLDFPEGAVFDNFEINLLSSSGKTTSPFSLETIIYDFGADRWEFSGSLHQIVDKEIAGKFTSFNNKLRGQIGSFLLPIPDGVKPCGLWRGEDGNWPQPPAVDGAGQTGYQISVRDMPPNQIGAAKAGDWINLGTGSSTRLYQITEDADTDGTGRTVLNVAPRLRESPNDGDEVFHDNAKGLFRLKDRMSGYSARPRNYQVSFDCEEVL